MILSLGLFTFIFCSDIYRKSTTDIAYKNKNVRDYIFDEFTSHMKMIRDDCMDSLPPDIRDALQTRIILFLPDDFINRMSTLLFSCDFNHHRQSESVKPLDNLIDYALSPIFNILNTRSASYASTHYQILLNSHWFLEGIQNSINRNELNPVHVLRNILDLDRSEENIDYKKLKLEAIALYAQVIIEHYYNRYLSRKISEPQINSNDSADVNLFRIFQVRIRTKNNPIDNSQDEPFKNIGFDLTDFELDQNENLTLCGTQTDKIITHGNIILLTNDSNVMVVAQTCLKLNGRTFILLGGQTFSLKKKFPRERCANVVKKNSKGFFEQITYSGTTQTIQKLKKDQKILLKTLYFEEISD